MKGSQKLSEYRAFYPSDASCKIGGKVIGRCLRYQYWRWMGVLPLVRNTWRMTLAVTLGEACETFFIDLYRRSGRLKATQFPFYVNIMDLNIAGRIDGLTKDGMLIECKSAFGTAFYNSVNKAPKPEHLCQIIVYMACLGLDKCILPYICRDNASKRQGYLITKEEIEQSGITMIGILGRWKFLKRCIEKKELPPEDYEPKSWQCSYCLYKPKCITEKQ